MYTVVKTFPLGDHRYHAGDTLDETTLAATAEQIQNLVALGYLAQAAPPPPPPVPPPA
jgi:hypothetical protein